MSKVKLEIKEEPDLKIIQNSIKEENSTDDDDDKLVIKDEPLSQDEADDANVSAASSCDYNLSHFKKDESQFEMSEEEQDDNYDDSQIDIKEEPLELKQEKEEDSDEDIPLVCIFRSTNTFLSLWLITRNFILNYIFSSLLE